MNDPTYTCPNCGRPTVRCSSPLAHPHAHRPNDVTTMQRTTFCSYRCWLRFYDDVDLVAIEVERAHARALDMAA